MMEYRNAFSFNDSITCEVNHPQHGWGPYTASATDVEPFSRQLYATIIAAGDAVPYEPPTLSDEELADAARQERNWRLSTQVDPVVSNPLRWADLSSARQQSYIDYRQALLDVPQQTGFPSLIEWPVAP